MPIALIFLTGLAFSTISILGVGFSILSLLKRAGDSKLKFPESYFVLSCALGILWSATFFVATQTYASNFDLRTVYIKGACDLAIIALGAIFAWRPMREMMAEITRLPGMIVIMLGGAAFGIISYLLFPYIFDSGQLKWTQGMLFGYGSGYPTAMPGYSGMVISAARIFEDIPVITAAGAFKPLLGVLAAAVAYHAISAVGLRNRLLNTIFLLVLMACSEFGQIGLANQGKDSIFGILFAFAFMAAICRNDRHISGLEIGIYFAAGTSIGIISAPYMIAAYVIWIAISTDENRISTTAPHILIVNIIVIPPAISGFFGGLNLLYIFIIYIVFLIFTISSIWRWPKAPAITIPIRVLALVPIALIILCAALMPVTLEMLAWLNADGTPVFQLRAPLDGKTNFYEFLFYSSLNAVPVGGGLASAALIGFTPLGRSRPGLIAIAIMPFAVLFALLLRSHFHIPLLSNFNVWDLVKDIPQWLGGTLFALLAVVTINALLASAPFRTIRTTLLSLIFAATAAATVQRVPAYPLFTPVTFSKIGGFQDKNLSEIGNIAWKNLRRRYFLMDDSIPWAKSYFYHAQIFDVFPSLSDIKTLHTYKNPQPFGLLVSNSNILHMRSWAATNNASLEYVSSVFDDTASVWIVRMDGKDEQDSVPAVNKALIAAGAHEPELDGRMVWLEKTAQITVTSTENATACLTLGLFSTNYRKNQEELVDITAGDKTTTINLLGTSMVKPAIVNLTIVPKDTTAEVTIQSRSNEISFPGDTRRIAQGLTLPLKVQFDGPCRN